MVGRRGGICSDVARRVAIEGGAAFMRATACRVGILVGAGLKGRAESCPPTPSVLPNQTMAYKWALPRPWTVCAYGGGWGRR